MWASQARCCVGRAFFLRLGLAPPSQRWTKIKKICDKNKSKSKKKLSGGVRVKKCVKAKNVKVLKCEFE